MDALHLTITGRVQGVFFRAEAKRRADELGITGWVRNTEDGGVELLAEGEKAALEKFLEWCKKGPERAHVNNVEAEWNSESAEKFINFLIK